MTGHCKPSQCLNSLVQEISDGGRSEFLLEESQMESEQVPPQGDCAIVALVHAMFERPSASAYRNARRRLETSVSPRVSGVRKYNETRMAYLWRRVRQCFRLARVEPMHETPWLALHLCLRTLGYKTVYPNVEQRWYCICDNDCSYAMALITHGTGHAIYVRQGIAYSTIEFVPEAVEVLEVWSLDSEITNNRRTRALKC